MIAILPSAALYTAVVFALGFALGTLRVLYLGAALGEFAAVLIELPIMLAFSWVVAGRVFRGRGFTLQQGIEIGLMSFLFLQLAEGAVAGIFGPYAFVDNVRAYWGGLSSLRLAGLAGQILFALFPIIEIARSRHHDR